MFSTIIFAFLFPTVYSANILGVFLYPAYSHHVIYHKIMRELSLRGHQVTVITTNPTNDHTLTNLTEIDVHFLHNVFKENSANMMYSMQGIKVARKHMDVTYIMTQQALNTPEVKTLISNKSLHFDLIFKYHMDTLPFIFGDRFKAPVIDIAPGKLTGYTNDRFANPNHPVLYPDYLTHISAKSANLFQKIEATYYFLSYLYNHYNYTLPLFDNLSKSFFGGDVSSLHELETNASMLFSHTHPLLVYSRPDVPAVIEILPLEKTYPKALPETLKTLMNNATEGIIYISFGTFIKSSSSVEAKIMAAVSELPYKVLFKWKSDFVPGQPSNVVTRTWFPQKDLLAHPNVKIFVTQGGLQSIEQSIAGEVPLIGMPFIGDQPANIQRIVDLGIAEQLDPETLTSTQLKDLIVQVAETETYKTRVKEIRKFLYDTPMTGLEKAVWWTEYVIRHKGAKHLKSAAVDMPYFEYFFLDVMLAVFSLVVLIYGICRFLIFFNVL